ncbi:MAG: hypothetical protein HQL50_01360 [Magnetococcales bacterium]|nr:hypothetical protein [Magnetococcales bacterium]
MSTIPDSHRPDCGSREQSDQQGSVLVISVVVLMILSIIGMQNMSTSVVQERMAGNERQVRRAFQEAETALRAGEEWLDTQLSEPIAVDSCGEPPCSVFTIDSADYDTHYTDGDWWSTNTNTYDDTDTNAPRYVIEELDQVELEASSGGTLTIGQGTSKPTGTTLYTYRVTSRGTSPSGNAVIVVQSVYARGF